MTEAAPYFFFSYCHSDAKGRYLHHFFEDLRDRIADLEGLGIHKNNPDAQERLDRVGFCDRDGITTGQDWMDKIGNALLNNAVLVCVYSPSFFQRRFCGQEFAAFLMRDDEARYVPGTGEQGQEFQLRGARNILPIVWEGERFLKKKDLPPYALRKIKWDLEASIDDEINKLYLKNGMRRIVIQGRARSRYDDIVTHFAERIIDLAKVPLRPLAKIPDIEKLRDAFWEPPEGDRVDNAAAAAEAEDAPPRVSGPQGMLVIIVGRVDDAADWTPYPGEPSIPMLVEEVANQNELITDWLALDPSAADFTDRTLNELRTAAESSMRAIVVVDPRCLANHANRETLIALLQKPCRAGLLLPADTADREAALLIEQYRAALNPTSGAPDWVVRSCVGSTADLRTAVNSVADDIRARIVNSDPVRRNPPENDGPIVRPRITNR
jgi:hypothetical protein